METENVHNFKYLGAMVNTNNSLEEEIKQRIATGNKTYYVHKAMFGSRALSRSSKLWLYNSVVKPVVTFASETWVFKKQIENELLTFEKKILRITFGPTTQSGAET
jgi:hypothetical protein